MGYHKQSIKKGNYGQVSKIQEELDELVDAIQQNNKIMALVELSDIIGSINGYLEQNFPALTIQDLIIMANATKSAFLDGSRK